MSRSINQSDLAVIAGVSTSTVSRALAGHPSVNAETQARIRDLAQAHNLRSNQVARNLRLRSTGAIGLALPLGHARSQHLTDPFFLSLLGLLTDRLTERGYDILLSRVIPTDAGWLDRMVGSGKIDGLLLIGQSDQYDTIERTAERFGPMVVWGVDRPGQRHVTIGSDNVLGGQMAGGHLIARGRRRLLFVGDVTPPEFADRLAGFRVVAAEGGASLSILDTSMAADAVHAAMHAHLAAGATPDGVFAASDVVAMSVLRALADHGCDVPGQVSVIGYDDVELATHTNPPLTTIRQDLAIGADLMVDRLLRRIAGEDARSAIVPPVLINREST